MRVLRILKVLQNPDNYGKSTVEKAKLAQVSRTYLYEVQERPEFQQLMTKTSLDMIREEIFPIIKAVVKKAKEGSYNHAKMCIDMAMPGVLASNKNINVTVHQGIEKHLKEWQEYQEYMKSMGEEVTDIDVEYSIEDD